MRFKKISDAETEKKKAEEQKKRQKEKLAASTESTKTFQKKEKGSKGWRSA